MIEVEYGSDEKKKHWSANIAEGCGCLMIALAIGMVMSFKEILSLIEKIFCD
jgi:hypothetical protein